MKAIQKFEKELKKLKEEVSDGFDQAFVEGFEVVLKELHNFDGGISGNYIKGVKHGVELFYQLEEEDFD